MQPTPITITQLNRHIKSIIETDPITQDISVKGEISNLVKHTSGHIYLSLKDEGAAVRAVMFRSAAQNVNFPMKNGMKVIARGRVSVYERDGAYQFYIESLQAEGIGDLYEAYELLKQKLTAAGIFDNAHKKPLPKFPRTVGVITSPTGAAVRDIVNIIKRRYPLCEVLIHPVLVQGEGASASVAAAIEYMNAAQLADVLIVGRGGGSAEDLWAFNEEATVMAIYNSEIPVISAVGHETDFTLSDFAADLRAPTPSAAAELSVPNAAELLNNLRQQYTRMLYCVRKTVESKRNTLKRFAVKNPADYVNQNRQYLDNLTKQMQLHCEAISSKKSNAFKIAAAKLHSLSPLSALSRGYSLAEKSGEILKSIAQAEQGDSISVRLTDGTLAATVTSKSPT